MASVDEELDRGTMGAEGGEGILSVFEMATEGAISKAGEVGAAAMGGWSAGRKLDEWTGASDKLSDALPGGASSRAATRAAERDGNTMMHGERWGEEKCRLDHHIGLGDSAAMARVCEPYKD